MTIRIPFDGPFRVASPFGWRTDPITGAEHSWHGGVDLVSDDRNVRAVRGGRVVRSRMVDPASGDKTWEWGNYVSVAGDDGMVIYYCHLESRAVEQGQLVSEGQLLGIEGSTGRSTGVHLHFELRDWAAQQKDPCAYLGIPNQAGYVWTPPAPEREPWEDQCHDWSREAVEWCISRGILKGDGQGNYRLGDAVTREEMCVMLWRSREVL